MEILSQLYKELYNEDPLSVDKLPGSGSNRAYYRLTGATRSVIGVVGTSIDENRAFIYLAHHFREQGLPVPVIYAVSNDQSAYLQQDLGIKSLYDVLKTGRQQGGVYNEEQRELLRKTIRQLPALQYKGAKGLDFEQCYPLPSMDRASVQFDLNYFKYDFLKFTEVDYHELKLEVDMHALADDLLDGTGDTFMYRDFQARNVMVVEGEPCFIDFQGGRRGPIYYDVASFLWQASAKYSSQLREELIGVYLKELHEYDAQVDEVQFRQKLNLFVLFRLLQVLGAYGFRGMYERKAHFLESIAPALHSLRELIAQNDFPYPYLIGVLKQLTALDALVLPDGIRISLNDVQSTPKTADSKGALVVRVCSFSYKKGIPADTSGNGGGYVFDCRSTHNPGRYEAYKKMTGLDQPVKDFLEKDGEILTFLESVYKLADAHVERYMQRSFTHLMFAFGCTGGQHRSVYSAQHLAEHLHQKYGVEVHLCHREQQISTVYKQKQ